VIDALDECDRDDVRTVLSLLQRLKQTHLRVFLTSRPELPIRLGFAQMPTETHCDVILHHIPPSTIQHDISVYLKDEFARSRKDHQRLVMPDQRLAPDNFSITGGICVKCRYPFRRVLLLQPRE
jgi:hypothetical protein